MEKVFSFFLYYTVFLIAFAFFLAADRTETDSKARLFTVLGVLVLCLFAGARDLSVGIDTQRTVLARFIKIGGVTDVSSVFATKEAIYRIISFFLHKITHAPWSFLFTVQMLTAGPVALCLYKYRKKALISIGMLVYMLMFFQDSLNITRQCVAAAFMLLAVVECFEKAYFKGLVIAIISCLFHRSGVIGIAMCICIYIVTSIKNFKTRMLIIFLTLVSTSMIVLNWRSIFSWLIANHLLIQHYSTYVAIFSGESTAGGAANHYINTGGSGWLVTALRMTGIAITLYILDFKIKDYDYDVLFMKYGGILSALIFTVMILMFQTRLGNRLTLYVDFFQILLFSRIYTIISHRTIPYKNGEIHITNLDSLDCLVYAFLYNICLFMILGFGGTVPYLFS